MREISPGELSRLLQSAAVRPLLIDVREPWEHETVKLEGSVLLPLSSFKEGMKELKKDQNIVVYCHHGIRSGHAVRMMEENKFGNVANLRGGIDAWSHEVDPDVPTY